MVTAPARYGGACAVHREWRPASASRTQARSALASDLRLRRRPRRADHDCRRNGPARQPVGVATSRGHPGPGRRRAHRAARSAQEVGERVEGLRERMEAERLVDISRPVPEGVPLRRDGRPVTKSAVDRLLTTEAVLAEKAHVLTLAQRWADRGGTAQPDLPIDDEVTAVQHEAAAAVAGSRRLVLVVGPAGTGKTTALRPAVARLEADGRPLFGVAPSTTAAEVLAVDKILIEHRLDRPPDARYDLAPGATVIVDEAAMLATPRLAELIDLADRRGWRLALVGDPMQFSAVGRSGMFGHLVDTIGTAKTDLRRLPAQIAQLEAHLPALDAELGQARADLGAAVAEFSNPDTEQRTVEIRAALDQER